MRHIALVAALLIAAHAPGANAAADYLLEIDGLKGETAAGSATTGTVRPTLVDDAPPATVSTTFAGSVGTPFVLDGSRSIDDGAVGRFMWTQLSGPRVPFPQATATPSVTPTSPGTYEFELVVTDATGRSSVAQRVSVVVGGETTAAGSAGAGTGSGVAAPTAAPTQGSVDVFLEIDGVKGESTKGAEPETPPLDVAQEPAGLTPDFSILLGGGGEEGIEERRAAVSTMLAQGLASDGVQAVNVTIHDDAVTAGVRTNLKIFGFIPAVATAVVDIDKAQRVTVKYPWWSFLASGKDEAALGARVFTSISNVLKTKHDTIKNSINNVR